MAKNKVSRKQLLKEPDEFLTLSARFLAWGVKYKNQVTWAGIGLLVLVVAIAGIRYYAARTESRSFALLSQAVMNFSGVSQEKGPGAAFLAAEEDFKSLIKKFGGTDGGKIGRIIYADLGLQGGHPDTAVAMYKQALEDYQDEPLIRHGLLLSLAYALEAKKEYAAAAEYLETLAATPEALGADEAVYNLGRLYELLGDAQKSRRHYEKLLEDHPDFIYSGLVRDKLAATAAQDKLPG